MGILTAWVKEKVFFIHTKIQHSHIDYTTHMYDRLCIHNVRLSRKWFLFFVEFCKTWHLVFRLDQDARRLCNWMWMQPTWFRLKRNSYYVWFSYSIWMHLLQIKLFTKNQMPLLVWLVGWSIRIVNKIRTYFWKDKSTKMSSLTNLWSPSYSVMVHQLNVKLQTAISIS